MTRVWGVGAAVIPRHHRGGAPPPIRPTDARRGLLHLMTTGLIPRHADVTAALVGDVGGLQQRPAVLHDHGQQFVHGFVATCQPPANLVLDLGTPVRGAVADALKVRGAAAAAGGAAAEVAACQAPPRLSPVTIGEPSPPQQPPGSLFAVDDDPVSVSAEFVHDVREGPGERAREFDELLDTYSLHQFMIRHGYRRTGRLATCLS